MIWVIAIRNLWQHRTKTLIIGTLVALGISLTFVGNALIDSMIRNISTIFSEYYTGDILVTSTETLGAGVFGAQSDDTMGFPTIPVLKDYDRVMEKVQELEGVEGVTRQISGYAMFNMDGAAMEYGLFFGVEPDSYFSVMDGIEIIEGRRLQGSEQGLMLGLQSWEKFKNDHGLEIKAGDVIQLNSFGLAGIKIIELPVVGIFRFPLGNERFFPMSIMDAGSLRYLLGRSGGVAEKVPVSAEATVFLESDLDALFDSDTFGIIDSQGPEVQVESLTEENLFDIGVSGTALAEPEEESKDWHFIVIRTKKGVDPQNLISKLNRSLDDADLLARSQGWWVSAMPDSLTYSGVQILFNVAIYILGFVSIIIIMNTLVVSVMERTSEIGTMRALGASKGFVARMFIAETGFITAVFGAAGLLLGILIILLLNRAGIPTDNDALRFLGGGGIVRPVIGSQPLILSFILMGIIALFSWIYPVLIALKISPIKAISTE